MFELINNNKNCELQKQLNFEYFLNIIYCSSILKLFKN